MRSRRNSDVLKCPSLPVDNEACCACARIPDGALGRIIGCWQAASVRGRFVFVRQIFWLSLSLQMNNTSRETQSYFTLCIYVSIYLSTWILNESFVFMSFWNNDYSWGLAGHMWPATSAVQPASAQCCWLCHLSSDGLVESDCTQSGTVHRKYTGLLRRIDRNEYYFALLYIVRQVTIPYSALQFRRNSPVFWCFEIPCQDIRYLACGVGHACGSRCTRVCKHWAPLWFTKNSLLLMWILSIPISIIDLNVQRRSTTKLM